MLFIWLGFFAIVGLLVAIFGARIATALVSLGVLAFLYMLLSH